MRETHKQPVEPAATASPESLGPMEESVPVVRVRTGGPGISEDGRLRSGRLAGLSMWGAIVALAWPVVADSILGSMVGLTDTVLAAQISEAATDAIAGASYLLWFIGLVIMALDVGATALVARAVGAGRFAVANAALGQVLVLGLFAGVLVGGVLMSIAVPAAHLMNMGSGEAELAFVVFMRWTAAGVPFMGVLFAGMACARGAGDTFRPLLVMIVVNLVNMGSSWALAGTDFTTTRVVDGERITSILLANPFPFRLGPAGIAIGTTLGHAVGAALVVYLSAHGWAGLRLRRRRLRPHWHTMRRILRVGFTNFLETFGMWVCNFLVILMVGLLPSVSAAGARGQGLLGAHILAVRIEAFSYLPGFGLGAAAAALAGQYLGAGAPLLARRAVVRCTAIAVASMGVSGAVFVLFSERLVMLFSSQPTHVALSPRLLFITGWVQVPFAIGTVLRSAMRGAGDVRAVMWLTWLTQYGARLPLVYAVSGVDLPLPAVLGGGVLENPFPMDGGLTGLWIALCIEVVLRAVVFAHRFAGDAWLKCRV